MGGAKGKGPQTVSEVEHLRLRRREAEKYANDVHGKLQAERANHQETADTLHEALAVAESARAEVERLRKDADDSHKRADKLQRELTNVHKELLSSKSQSSAMGDRLAAIEAQLQSKTASAASTPRLFSQVLVSPAPVASALRPSGRLYDRSRVSPGRVQDSSVRFGPFHPSPQPSGNKRAPVSPDSPRVSKRRHHAANESPLATSVSARVPPEDDESGFLDHDALLHGLMRCSSNRGIDILEAGMPFAPPMCEFLPAAIKKDENIPRHLASNKLFNRALNQLIGEKALVVNDSVVVAADHTLDGEVWKTGVRNFLKSVRTCTPLAPLLFIDTSPERYLIIKPHPDKPNMPQWTRETAAHEFERLFELICVQPDWEFESRTYQRYFSTIVEACGERFFSMRLKLTGAIAPSTWKIVSSKQTAYEKQVRADDDAAWRLSISRAPAPQRQSFPQSASASSTAGAAKPKATGKPSSISSTSSAVGKCWGCALRDHKWAECPNTNKGLTRVNNMPFDVEVGMAYCLQFNQGKDCSSTDHTITRRSDRCTVCQSKTHGLHNHS